MITLFFGSIIFIVSLFKGITYDTFIILCAILLASEVVEISSRELISFLYEQEKRRLKNDSN